MSEIWMPVVGYEDIYAVSSLGRVKALARTLLHPKNRWGNPHLAYRPEKILSQTIDKYGYWQVGLHKNGKGQTVNVHRLMGMAFLGHLYFDGAQINHKNHKRGDNSLQNIEWVTSAKNIQHSFLNGRRATPNKSVKTSI